MAARARDRAGAPRARARSRPAAVGAPLLRHARVGRGARRSRRRAATATASRRRSVRASSRSTSTSSSSPARRSAAAEIARALARALQPYLFGEDERTIAEIVLDLCRERGLTLATAESCTGGLVAARLTSDPGLERVFRGGVVAYANEVKEQELGVPASLLGGARRRLGRGRRGDGAGRARAPGRRRRRRGDRRRRPGRRDATRSPSGSCTCTRAARRRRRAASSTSPAIARWCAGARRPPRSISCADCWRVGTHLRERLPLPSRAMSDFRLFLALELPAEVTAALAEWGRLHLARRPAARDVPRHPRLPRRHAAASSSTAILAVLRRDVRRGRPVHAPAAALPGDPRPSACSSSTTRAARRRSWRRACSGRLERLGVYRREARPWLPHVTVLRFRERPRLAPPLPDIGTFAPSGAAAFLFTCTRRGRGTRSSSRVS